MSQLREADVHAETLRRGETETAASSSYWVTLSFGEVCQRVQNAAMPSQDGERLYLGLEHLASGQPSLVGRGRESDVKSGKTGFRSGDVLFGKLRPYLRKSVLVTEDGICSTDILAFRSLKNCIPEYLCFLTHTDEFIAHSVATTSGVQHPRTSWSTLRDFKFALPPLAEQQKIAGVLGLVQRAIEQQERLIALTTELKKALLHKLFTEGLRGEPQKQTEISPVPESWEVKKLGEVISEDPKNGLYKHNSAYGSGTRILRINDFSNDGDVVTSAPNRVTTDAVERELYALRKDDIVTNRVNSLSHLGKTALVGELTEPMAFESNMMRFRVDEQRAIPLYILRLLNSPICKKQIIGSAKRAVAQSSINQGNLKGILLPLPPVVVQEEISAVLETVVAKGRLLEMKRQSLTDLFRTLLHQLMTAQTRVNNLDLEKIGHMKTEAT